MPLFEDRIRLRVSQFSSEIIKKSLQHFYREQAKSVFEDLLSSLHPRLAHLSIPYPELRVRKMKNRWGSCSLQGFININLDLIQTPLVCIEYVIAHELCHYVEFNHSPRFHRLMDEVMPDWQERKKILDAFILA